MNKYIVVAPDLSVSLADVKPRNGFAIPAERKNRYEVNDIYINGRKTQRPYYPVFGSILSIVEVEKVFERTGHHIEYSLLPPDPWFIALCTLMWQGAVQNMSWEAMKVVLATAIGTLRTSGVAPTDPLTTKSKFYFEFYIELGQLLRIFVKMQRMRENKRVPSLPPIETRKRKKPATKVGKKPKAKKGK